jgi:type II secretory pathway component PulF
MQHTEGVLAAVRQGHEVYEALAETGAFPPQFVDMVRVGEESGTLVESMAHLAEQYQERARLAMGVLTVLMGVAVFALVGLVIIFLIFRIFGFYANTLNDALKMRP